MGFDSRLIDYSPEYRDEFPTLDKWFPFTGPCFCEVVPDTRHRVWDAIMERSGAGDSVDVLSEDYGVPVEAIKEVLKVRPYEALCNFIMYEGAVPKDTRIELTDDLVDAVVIQSMDEAINRG